MSENTPPLKHPHDRPYFFDGGVQFTCTQCGHCCTGNPGYVYVNEREQEEIRRFVEVSPAAFRKKYLRKARRGTSLVEQDNGDCIFYREGRCLVYPVRPKQCRTYPFWPETMRSEASWKKTCAECPGIGQGEAFSREQILDLLNTDYTV